MTRAAADAAESRPPAGGTPSRIADRGWYDRSSTRVAPDLLGALLVHDTAMGRIAGVLTEVEAYQGPEDRAAHSWRGRTARNAVMFGPPGHLYVYLIYGIHFCANIVCGPGDKPEAVLLRGALITEGEALARLRRGEAPQGRLATGPGNLAAAFGITREMNGADLTDGPLWVAQGTRRRYRRTPRVGVGYAGAWAERRLRYVVR